jgi:succinate dehydrogenase/fumarate reductase cytochrome b subunit
LFKFLKSTILIKIVMALTGLVIVGFLFIHAIGNLQYWLGPDAYNTYAAFLQSPLGIAEILWVVRIGLIVCLILHIIAAVYLRLKNNAAKPIGYQIKNYAKAKLTTRTMLWGGLLLLSGIVFHLLHFTAGVIDFEGGYAKEELYPTRTYVMDMDGCADENTCHKLANKDCCGKCEDKSNASCCVTNTNKPCQEEKNTSNSAMCNAHLDSVCSDVKSNEKIVDKCSSKGECCSAQKECYGDKNINIYDDIHPNEVMKLRPDVYGMVTTEFSNPWVVLSYVLFVILVGFHLNHSIQSAIHTLGIEGPKFTPVMRVLSTLLSIALVLLFIILPLGVLAKTLGLCSCCIGGL